MSVCEKVNMLDKTSFNLKHVVELQPPYNNNNYNKSFISSQWTYTCIHTYLKSLRYKRKVHQQLETLFIHHFTSSGKVNQTKYSKC